jgi:hypothetical protein
LSFCSADEVEATVRLIPEMVSTHPLHSILLLADFNGASFDAGAIRAMKESAVFDKPYIKKSAWIGAADLQVELRTQILIFSGREMPIFRTRQEALDYLLEN